MTISKSIIYSCLLTLSIVLVGSCGHNHAEGESHGDHDHSHGPSSPHEEGEMESDGSIHLTDEQIKTIGLEFGDFSNLKINDYVIATGTLGVPPNAYSSVTTKSSGMIKDARKYVEGEYVKKGEVIAYLENPEWIKLEQNYLETKAQLQIQQLNVDRQRSLVDAQAGVERTLQEAQAQVQVLTAQMRGMEQQLSYYGIKVQQITPDNIIYRTPIQAESAGYVTYVNFHNGKYVQSSDVLMNVLSSEHLHLELDVFEKDISKIKKGQNISYTIPALGKEIFQGTISEISKELQPEGKVIKVHGHIEGKRPMFVKDLFLNAKIWLSEHTAQALPREAVFTDGETTFIFVGAKDATEGEVQFQKINVQPGAIDNGYQVIQMIDPIPPGMKIVTKGAYYVHAQSKAGELSHEH